MNPLWLVDWDRFAAQLLLWLSAQELYSDQALAMCAISYEWHISQDRSPKGKTPKVKQWHLC